MNFEQAISELKNKHNGKGVVRRKAWGSLNMFVEFDGNYTVIFRGYAFEFDFDIVDIKREIIEESDWYVVEEMQTCDLKIHVMDFKKNSYR